MTKIDLYNKDNMLLMKDYPDKYFDLAIVDPPYRDLKDNQPTKDMRNNGSMKDFGNKPNKSYFEELFRVSKNQIIWGANNFNDLLPNNCGFVIYKKKTISDTFTMSMCEYAWINNELSTISKLFEYAPQDKYRIHPTQKPTALYRWLLEKYAKQGDKILDTHLGSMSIVQACIELGFDLTGCELDQHYFLEGKNRIDKFVSQLNLFQEQPEINYYF